MEGKGTSTFTPALRCCSVAVMVVVGWEGEGEDGGWEVDFRGMVLEVGRMCVDCRVEMSVGSR